MIALVKINIVFMNDLNDDIEYYDCDWLQW
jgi:hypothetical protein